MNAIYYECCYTCITEPVHSIILVQLFHCLTICSAVNMKAATSQYEAMFFYLFH